MVWGEMLTLGCASCARPCRGHWQHCRAAAGVAILHGVLALLLLQFAQDEDGGSGDFAVVEYESAEQAESVRGAMDGVTINGRRVQVSFCAPGAPGRSTLAALIAAQRMVSISFYNLFLCQGQN